MGQPETLIKNSQFNDLFADQMEELMATYEHHHNHCHKD
jgi:zinc transport system ATP-binding protein